VFLSFTGLFTVSVKWRVITFAAIFIQNSLSFTSLILLVQVFGFLLLDPVKYSLFVVVLIVV
jgi:hypothetical protein